MVWRIGLVGALAALLAGCLAPPAPGGAGDAAPVDVADAIDHPDVPVVVRDAAVIDRPPIDFLSDPNNCGAPYVHCSNGIAQPVLPCVAGRCACAGNRAGCGSMFACIIDLDTDNRHCGSCDTICSADSRCTGGRCVPCAEGYATCGRADAARCSVDLTSDNVNCGGCDTACSADTRCVGGRCVPCPDGFGTCGRLGTERCSHRLDDFANCGACGRVCGDTERCVDGSCQACPAGLTLCSRSTCLDLQSDPANCGACGRRCGLNETCTLGRCTETPCPEAGERRCDPTSTRCIPVLADPMNCGVCGLQCLAGGMTSHAVCTGGVCVRTCRPGFASCGSDPPCSTEIDFRDDHCGACDVRCGALTRCIGGVCASVEARPLAPLSTLILGVQRPRFRWQRASGVDGVRLQLCADRACTRVESTRDLTGDEHRPDLALTPGVHFWRLFARRGASVAASSSPVWEFVVPAVDTGREVVDFLEDIDGDGVEDEYVRGTRPAVRLSGAPGEPQEVTLPPPRRPFDDATVDTESASLGISGDIDGDGYGDLVGSHTLTREQGGFRLFAQSTCTVIRGGAPRFASTFRDVVVPSASPGYVPTSCGFSFDLNGDGYGDIVSHSQLSRTDRADAVRFGAQDGWTIPASDSLWEASGFHPSHQYTSVDSGDFDGDGRMDLLHIGRDGLNYFISSLVAASFARGVNSPVFYGLPGCAAAGTTRPPVARYVEVLDANRDGFDDVTTGPSMYLGVPGGYSTYLGGPGGFTSDRCVYSLIPP